MHSQSISYPLNSRRSARPLFHTHFVADHPFAFLIYDKAADAVLFFGMYQDPEGE